MNTPQKIAILGGGVGAVVTAFELTSQPDWQKRYDITLYQMGWRLGGKGASGRNAEDHQRIEEHGIHVWLGFYENAFSAMRRCYSELGRNPGQPLATWDEAFKPWKYVGVTEDTPKGWVLWIEQFATNPQTPGSGQECKPLWELMVEGLVLIAHAFGTSPLGPSTDETEKGCCCFRRCKPKNKRCKEEEADEASDCELVTCAEELLIKLDMLLSGIMLDVGHALLDAIGMGERLAAELLSLAIRLAKRSHRHLHVITRLLSHFRKWLWHKCEPLIERNTVLRRSFIVLDLGVTMLLGCIADDVLFLGLGVLDRYDFREWLRKYGAQRITVDSALVRGSYELPFAHDPSSPTGFSERADIAAGVLIRAMAKTLLDYRGSIFFQMQAGMGDVVFAPFYQVLKQRGVKFEFFHKVRALHIDPSDPTQIGSIEIERQVNVKSGIGGYEPLVDVKGLPCWPSLPLFDQIEDGDKLREGWDKLNYNLESRWSSWTPVETRALRKGTDFDLVVLGISLGALSEICAELVLTNGRWRAMVEGVTTVQTLAMQLWLSPTLAGLGWTGAPTILDAYAQPFNTYADMSQLIEREVWPAQSPASETPQTVAYFCGALADAEPIPPPSDHDFPKREYARVALLAAEWLRKNPRLIWPQATQSTNPDCLNWDLLVDDHTQSGIARLSAQYFRANIDPSERYVRSPKGTTHLRLYAGESGYKNLYLAGDWTRTGLDVGCVEAATMSGMQASRAISGYPQKVVGERDSLLSR